MTNKVFEIARPSAVAYVFIISIIAVMFVALFWVAYSIYNGNGSSKLPFFFGVLGVAVIVAVIIFLIYTGCSMGRTKFVLDENSLTIKAVMYGRKIPIGHLVTGATEIVDLKSNPSFRPTMRTNGIGMPGYGEGWFRLKNKEKALLFVTQQSHVVCIPTTQGYRILLSPAKADEFTKVINPLK